MGTVNRIRGQERSRQNRGTAYRGTAKHRHADKTVLGPTEKRRLLQLAVSLVLFLAVFIGKGIFPERMALLREEILAVIQQDTDFEAAFSELGQAVSQGEPVTEALGILWGNVLGDTDAASGSSENYRAQAAVLCGLSPAVDEASLWTDVLIMVAGTPQPVETTAPEEPEPEPQPEPTPAPEPAVEHIAYDGPTLPDNTTMDKYNLSAIGIEETATPALGWVSSPFGWREHPVDGEERFHNGVDLAVNSGTDVLAFAEGTVDYIGESPEYGLYLQLSHAGGLTTFYCHCSRLCVQQGQSVAVGEKVAESGATGNVTGPHLHFEMKLNGVRLNPVYYIQTQ